MIIMLCHEYKPWGPHACIYVMCILGYFSIMLCSYGCIRHDIMWVFFFFLWRSATCNALCPTKPDSMGMYTSPPIGSMCAYMGGVWGSITYPTLLETGKSMRSCYDFKRIGLKSCYVCDCITNPKSGLYY